MHTIPQSVVNRRQFRRLSLLLALAFAWTLSSSPVTFGQQPDGDFEGEHSYKEADGTEVAFTDPKAAKSKVPAILRAGKASTAEEEKHFTDFFRYRIAEMTWKESITSLPTKRKDLKNYLGQAGKGAAPDLHVRLNKWILEELQKVAKDERYPRAIRLNCVLMISDLDQREARVGGPPQLPLAEAEPVLFGIFKDEAQHDALRTVAMLGLMRHAEANLTGDQRSELVGAMTKLLKTQEPAKGKSAVGHQWMRMLGCHLLSTLAGKGAEANQPEVVDAFQALIREKGAELWLRCHATGEMGYLQSKAFPQEKVLPLSQQLADLVVEVAQTNDRLMAAAGVAAPKKPAAPPKPKADNRKEGDGAEQAPPPAIPETVLKLAAEDVADELIRIRRGLTGVEAKESAPSADHALYAAGDADAKTFIKEIVGRIDGMLKKLKDAKKELHEQLADVSSDGGELQTWLKQQGANAGEKPEKVVAPSGAKPAGKPAPGAAAGRPSGNAGATESTVNP